MAARFGPLPRPGRDHTPSAPGVSVWGWLHLVHGVPQRLVEGVDVLALLERRDGVVEAQLELGALCSRWWAP